MSQSGSLGLGLVFPPCILHSKCNKKKKAFITKKVRMAERSKALRSGRSRVLPAWVRVPLLTQTFWVEVL